MAKRLQLLHKSGLLSKAAATEWINSTLATRKGLIGEPIVAIYTENGVKHALLAIGTEDDSAKYQIIDIDSVKGDLENAINSKLSEVTGSNAITVTDKNKIALKIDTTNSKGNVVFEQDANGLKANVNFPDNIGDISKKLDIGEENDVAGTQTYYGLKKDIASAVSSVYRVKGTCTFAELASKTASSVIGDVWNVTDAHGNVPAGTNYVYTGSEWDALGGTVDLSGYSKTGHKHVTDDVTGGTFNIARIPTGTSATSVALGNHNHDTAYAAKSHTHAISDVTDLQTTLNGKVDNSTYTAYTAATKTAIDEKAAKSDLSKYLPLDGGTMTENKGIIMFRGYNNESETSEDTKELVIGTCDKDDSTFTMSPYISFNGDAVLINSNGITLGTEGKTVTLTIDKDSDLKLMTTEDDGITLRNLFGKITTLEETVSTLETELNNLKKSAITNISAGDSDIAITGSGNTRTIILNSVTGGELE